MSEGRTKCNSNETSLQNKPDCKARTSFGETRGPELTRQSASRRVSSPLPSLDSVKGRLSLELEWIDSVLFETERAEQADGVMRCAYKALQARAVKRPRRCSWLRCLDATTLGCSRDGIKEDFKL